MFVLVDARARNEVRPRIIEPRKSSECPWTRRQWRCTKIAAHFRCVLRARRSPRSWRAKVSNSEAIMVRENIAMIVEEISRPLNVAMAHLDIWACGK